MAFVKCGQKHTSVTALDTKQNRKYLEYVKQKLAYDKINKKAAKRKLMKEDGARHANIGPTWYQGLSYKQMNAAEALGACLRADIEEGITSNTLQNLIQLGINPRPSEATLLYAMKRCYMNPIIFLFYLYKVFGTTPLNQAAKYFCLNDRLILTAMTHLALPRTLADLCLRLPHLPKPLKKYPAVQFTKFPKKESPYLEIQPFYKHVIMSEEREAARKRKGYLKKLQALKQKHDLVLPFIHLTDLDNSMRYDGRDQIPQVDLDKNKDDKPKKKQKMKNSPQETSEDKGNSESPILRASDIELLQHKSMRLPEPVLTEQTIIAMLAGYWQNIYGRFTPPPPTQEDQDLAKEGGQTFLMCLAQNALARMAKRGNPLSSLQDCHTLPQIKMLVRHLRNVQLNEQQKERLLSKSRKQWNVSVARTPQIPCEAIQFGSSLTWGTIDSFKQRNSKHAQHYLDSVCRAMVDDTREFWSSMASDYFNIPGFRQVFFTYLPGRVEDITFKYTT